MIFTASHGDLVFSKVFDRNIVNRFSRTLLMEGLPNHCAYLATHDTVIRIIKIDPFPTPGQNRIWGKTISGGTPYENIE